MMGRWGLIAALCAAVGAFFAWDIQAWLHLDALQAHVHELQQWRDADPWRAGAVFFGVYVAVTALSLPGATVMTLAGGALFGLGWGLLLVSFASTLGATLAFGTARYLLHDPVQARFGERLQRMRLAQASVHPQAKTDAHTEADADTNTRMAYYLFTLRLVPAFPFFLINVLMGLLPIRLWTFYWVSQLGMLAGTVVYVNAGTQLAQIHSLSGIVSPAVLGSLVLLGLFPWVAKAALARWQRGRVYARWQAQKPRCFDRNLVVIGAGAAGLVTAYIAAAVKARVTLVEAQHMGGDCLNHGCVPSKALIRSAKLAHQMRHAAHLGLRASEPVFEFRGVMQRVQEVIRAIAPHDSVERYTALGVDVRLGQARILNPWTVEICGADGRTECLTTRSIVIATGAQPWVPPVPGLAALDPLTSDTLWARWAERDTPPGRLLVLGGGPIGCELAQSLARLGSAVTLVERAPRVLSQEDAEVSAAVHQALVRDGVRVLVGHETVRFEAGQVWLQTLTEEGEAERASHLLFDEVLCAVGRVARLEGYGLETLGIPTERTVTTNAYLETLYPNIYAAGDVAGPLQLTHTAAHQAWYAAVNALFGRFKRFKVDNTVIPRAIFVDPEVARVGLNEQEAQAQGVAYEVTRYGLDDLDRAIMDGAAHGFVKVLTVPGRDRILGVTIVGEHAAEVLAEFVLAMKHGLGLSRILGTVHLYPSWAEANKYAAGVWKREHAPQRVLRWLQRYHAWQRR